MHATLCSTIIDTRDNLLQLKKVLLRFEIIADICHCLIEKLVYIFIINYNS